MGEPFRKSAEYYDARYCEILDYSRHCDSLEKILAKHGFEESSSILDIACGTGTHCLELASRGHHAVGIDISPEMLGEAQRKASEHPQKGNVRFVLQDMREIELGETFDVAICMFGGFGYLNTEDEIDRFFPGLRRHLKLGGLFIFQFWNIGGLKDSPYKTWYKTPLEDGTLYNLSESNFDNDASILRITMEHIVIRKHTFLETFIEHHNMRIYSLSEIRALLSTKGFELIEALDEMALESFSPPKKDTFRIMAVARKGAQ